MPISSSSSVARWEKSIIYPGARSVNICKEETSSGITYRIMQVMITHTVTNASRMLTPLWAFSQIRPGFLISFANTLSSYSRTSTLSTNATAIPVRNGAAIPSALRLISRSLSRLNMAKISATVNRIITKIFLIRR